MGGEWITRQLADVVAFENKRRIPLSAAQRSERPGDIPYWGANGPFATVDDHLFDGPRVLVAEDGNTVVRPDGRGTVHWADGKYWVNNHAHVLGVQDNHSLRWLYYALLTAQVGDLVSGSAQPKLSMGSLKRLPLSVPPLPEQRAIATVLGALDDKIESNRRLADGVDELMLHAAASVSGSQETLGTVARLNCASYSHRTAPLMIGYIDISSVSPRRVNEIRVMPFVEAPSRARRQVRSGDTILSTVRPERRSFAFIHSADEALVASTGFAVLTPSTISPVLLYALATSDAAVKYYAAVATGSAYPAMSSDALGSFAVAVPADRGRSFDSKYRPLMAVQAGALSEARTLTSLRDALLPKLVSGQIRVPLSDDPAESLKTVVAEVERTE